MGRKSVKENKNIYQQCREDLELTRESAAELLGYISADRIEKIESEKSLARPEEVLTMAACYNHPELCNYYCSHECPIGIKTVPEIKPKELSQITLEMLATLNALNKEKDRLIEITVDGVISDSETEDFNAIRQKLNEMAISIETLRLWVEKAAGAAEAKD